MHVPRVGRLQLVDRETASPSALLLALRQAGLVLLCAAWALMGLVGHDPWKAEDALTFGSAWEMVQRHDFLVPHIAGTPTFERAPFAAQLGAFTLELFSPPLAPHDAARIGAGALLIAILALTAWTGRELGGRTLRWMPVLVLVGSLGLFDRAHQLSPELALTLAIAAALYGIALSLRRAVAGGAVLGLAIGIGFLSYGYAGPLWIGACALAMLLASPWRTRRYARALAIAVAVGVPLAAAWPAALYLRSPALFDAWLASESLAEYLAFLPGAQAASLGVLPKNVVWFAWPALPLIAWTLWIRMRGFNGGMRQPAVQAPALAAIVLAIAFLALPDARLVQALPLLVPLALLASIEVDSLERGMSAALDWFGILTFGLAAILLWTFWIDSYVNGMSPRLALMLRDTETGYGPSFHLGTMLQAIALTVLWVVLVRPARRSNRRAILNWAAGVTLIWGLIATIWLPYIDSRRTYRAVAQSAAAALPRGGCVASRNVGEAQRALFYYFSGVTTVPDGEPRAASCDALLVQYGAIGPHVPDLDGWRTAWSGARRGDSTERFAVYLRDERDGGRETRDEPGPRSAVPLRITRATRDPAPRPSSLVPADS